MTTIQDPADKTPGPPPPDITPEFAERVVRYRAAFERAAAVLGLPLEPWAPCA